MSTKDNPLLTDEDRKALKYVASHTNRSFAVRHVREAGLKLWMRQFAAWYALEGNALSRKEQLTKLRYFAKDRVRTNTFYALLARPDFQDLINRFSEDQVAATREQFQNLLPKVVESVEWSIDEAKRQNDYKAIPTVVDPILTRTIPKKEEASARPAVIVLNLGGFAQQYAEAEIQEPEVIALPPPNDEPEPAA